MEKIMVKAYIPEGLDKALQEELDICGCSKSQVIWQAIAAEVHKRRESRRNHPKPLPGQLEIKA